MPSLIAAESPNRDTKTLILELYRAERYVSHIDKSMPWFMTLCDSFCSLHSETKPKFAWLRIEYRLTQIARRDERARQSTHTHNIGNRIFAVRDIWIYESQAVSARIVFRIQPRETENSLLTLRTVTVTNQQVIRSKAKLPSINHEQEFAVEERDHTSVIAFAAFRSLLRGRYALVIGRKTSKCEWPLVKIYSFKFHIFRIRFLFSIATTNVEYSFKKKKTPRG